tara:strand:- start:459 stop:1601 length:1143 start_codon:yes stop_codon:yes gene_type:complete
MIKINSPFSILEFGSTKLSLAIYDKSILNQSSFYEEKIEYTSNEKSNEEKSIVNIIKRAEKDIGQHLNEVILMLDSYSIYSIDFSIQKNYDKKIISPEDIDYLIKECENIIKTNNKEKEILHTIKSQIIFDDKVIENLENISQEVYKVTLELKFILINKKIYNFFKNLFFKRHISIKNTFCSSYIKSLGLINENGISGYSSFIDIGIRKSSITIFKEDKLLYLNNIHIGGDHITKDISKILKIDYRKAEAQKLKFYRKNKSENNLKNDELLKKIINSRLEEIIELLFSNCPLVKGNIFNSELKLYFIGNGSKVLNKNLLAFGSELDFINEMSIIDERKKAIFDSALRFNSISEKNQDIKPILTLENKGFFERLFEYLAKK